MTIVTMITSGVVGGLRVKNKKWQFSDRGAYDFQ